MIKGSDYNTSVMKAASIELGAAYKVKTDYGEEFRGILVFSREGCFEFLLSDGSHKQARAGKCKLNKIEHADN